MPALVAGISLGCARCLPCRDGRDKPGHDAVGASVSKVGIVRTAFILAAFTALELLCRGGIINRVTMIPPSEMMASLWNILRTGRYNEDIFFTLFNVIAASFIAIVVGFFVGAGLHALPRLRRRRRAPYEHGIRIGARKNNETSTGRVYDSSF